MNRNSGLFQKPLGTILVCLFFCLSSGAQQADRQRPAERGRPPYLQSGSSEFERENLDRVAASAGQIVAILQRDAGLLVELKRWVAKEAADNGQLLEEMDLTDGAVFDRLDHDVRFRSVATRLLQRYGYLLPSVNPNSDLAREQEMILKERARRLVQVEAQEDAAALEKGRAEGRSVETEECAGRHCLRAGMAGKPRRAQTAAEESEPQPNAPPPPSPRQRVPQGPGAIETVTTALANNGLDRAEQPGTSAAVDVLKQARETVPPGQPANGLISAGPGPTALSPFAPSEATGAPTSTGLRNTGDRGREFFAERRAWPDEEFAPVAMVRRPNPYADIPSLYDMYVQAALHQRPPERFGLDVFRNGVQAMDALPMDLPVGPDYVVGPGDGLAIDLWGGVSQRLFRTVDREGRVSLPETGPLLVSGRSLGEVQEAIQRVLRTQFRDISAEVSLSRLRTVRVYVVGDVTAPGAYDVSSLSTPLNALFEAGGVTPRGSLRSLKHYRGKQLVQEVDAYDLLLHGVRSDLKRLENGDTLLVPPIGPQVTVDGMVRRPAIYELHGEKSLADVLELAGGILPAAALEHIEVQRLEAHQKRIMLSLNLSPADQPEKAVSQLAAFEVRPADEIHIFPIAPYNEDAVYLQGHVLRPGRYAYKPDMKLTDLIPSYGDLLPEPAPHYAEIVRLNPPDFHPSVESFDLSAALTDPAKAPQVKPLDTVRIFSRYDFEPVPTVWVGGEVRAPGTYRTSGELHLRDAIFLAGGATPDADLESTQLFRVRPHGPPTVLSINLREALEGNPLDNILLQPRDRILVHRVLAKVDPPTVYVKGEVAKPGRYPLAANMRASDLLRAAGGLLRSADPQGGDLTHYVAPDRPSDKPGPARHQNVDLGALLAGNTDQDPLLRDGDILTVPRIAGWSDIGAVVSIQGEVRRPGVYGIQPGERLSSLLKRAGGLLPTAYARAAVFERNEVRELQQKSRQELIQRLEQESTLVRTSVNTSGSEEAALQQAALQQRQRTLEGLRSAPISGRMVIHLRVGQKGFEGSPDDIELHTGDSLTIPKQPGAVVVVGQVYNSNAITYVPGRNAGWYLSRAGGPTKLADKRAIFIVRADGSVASGGRGALWSGGVLSSTVGPGDLIVVPEKPVLGQSNAWKNVLAIAQIAQAGALAAAVAIP